MYTYMCACVRVYNLLPNPQISPFRFFSSCCCLTLLKRNPEAEYNAVASRTALTSLLSGFFFVPPKNLGRRNWETRI